MSVTIASEVIGKILSATGDTPDEEVCGLLLGTDYLIAGALPCRNVAADRRMRFEIDPAALIAAHRSARNGGPSVIGHYHSHPNGLAVPSPRDAADAAPDGSLWLIAAGGVVRGWRAVAAGVVEGRFDPVTLHDAPCASPAPPPHRDRIAQGT